MNDFSFDNNGIYKCRKCGERFAPGHSTRCHPTPALGDERLGSDKAFDETLFTGMEMLHSADMVDPPDIGRLL